MEKNKPQLEKLMTEGYISELDPKSGLQPNVNAEGGEYVMTPDGSVLQVLGEKHKKGGVNLILPGMTAILSDTKNATIKKADVKRLKEDYNLDNAKITDTYADVLDKYSRKIGLTKILVELEDSFKALKKQIDNPNASDSTYKINTNYIAKQIDELSKKKQVKDQAMQGMFSEMFASQEKAKKGKPLDAEYIPTEEVPEQVQEEPESAMIQEGIDQAENPENMPLQDPDQLTQPEMFELGGTVDSINSIASKYGWTPRRTYDHLLSKGLIKKYADGGVVPWDKFEGIQKDYQNIPNYRAGQLAPQSQRLSSFLGDVGLNGIPTSTQQEQDQAAGQYQTYLFNNMPEVAMDYSSTMPPTKAGLEYLIRNKIMTDADFAELGVSVPKRSGQVLGFKDGDLSEDVIQKVNAKIQEKLGTEEDKTKYLKTNFVDNLWYFRAPEVKTVQFQTEEEKEKTLKDYTDLGNGTYKSNKTGLYFKPLVAEPPKPQAKIRPGEEAPAKEVEKGKAIENDLTKVAPKSQIPRGYFMPDDSIMPPNALTPESLATLNLQRIDPVRVGIEPQMQNIARERNFAATQLASLPSSQRASVLANIVASSQQAESQAITAATQTNAQNFASAELFNIGQDTEEQQYNNASRLNYEARALRGLDNTQKDINEYFMANRAIHLNNYQQQMDMNRLDNLYPDVSIDMFGIGHYYDPQYQFQVQSPNAYAENALAMSRQQPAGK